MKSINYFLLISLLALSAEGETAEFSNKHDIRNSYLELPVSTGISSEGSKSHNTSGYIDAALVPILRSFPLSPFVYLRIGSGNVLSGEGGWGVRYTYSNEVYLQISIGTFDSATEPFDSDGDKWAGKKYRLAYYRYFPGSSRLIWSVNVMLEEVKQVRVDDNVFTLPKEKITSSVGIGAGLTFVLF